MTRYVADDFRLLPARFGSNLLSITICRKESVLPDGRLVRRVTGQAILSRAAKLADAPRLIPPVQTGFRRIRTLIEETIGSRMLYYVVTDEEI